jgi:hypothetical protein
MQRGVKFYHRMMEQRVNLAARSQILKLPRPLKGQTCKKKHIRGTSLSYSYENHILKVCDLPVFFLLPAATPRSWSKKRKYYRVWIGGPGESFWWKKTLGKKSGPSIPLNLLIFCLCKSRISRISGKLVGKYIFKQNKTGLPPRQPY